MVTKTKPGTILSTKDTQTSQRADAALESIDTLAQQLTDEEQQSSQPFEVPLGFKLSVVVPTFNEERTIKKVIDQVYELPLPLEVIVVDDGSTDGTVAILTQLNKTYPDLKVCIQAKNEGKGAALRKGFELAQGSHVVVQDADLEYNPAEIPGLVKPIVRDEADVVYGSRFLAPRWEGSSLVHRLGNRFLTLISNWMTGLSLTDMETCYKVLRRELLDNMTLEQDRFGFEVELTSKLANQGVRIVERPISYQARTWEEGKKIGIRDAFEALYCIVKYR